MGLLSKTKQKFNIPCFTTYDLHGICTILEPVSDLIVITGMVCKKFDS
jgi:hypothetical protein